MTEERKTYLDKILEKRRRKKENIIPQFKMPDISEIVSKIFGMLGNAFANAAEVSKHIAEDLKKEHGLNGKTRKTCNREQKKRKDYRSLKSIRHTKICICKRLQEC